MASKLGFILSTLFVVQLFVLFGDLISVQTIYTNLDAVSVTAGQLIAVHGRITEEIERLVENETGGVIEAITPDTAPFGSPYEYKLTKEYNPYIMSSEPLTITIVRSVVIGYFND